LSTKNSPCFLSSINSGLPPSKIHPIRLYMDRSYAVGCVLLFTRRTGRSS
jgi:hypothetical protein